MGSNTLIGRSAEVAAFGQALAQGRGVILVAAPGFGKSTFVGHVLRGIAGYRIATVIRAHGSDVFAPSAGTPAVPVATLEDPERIPTDGDARSTGLIIAVDDAHRLDGQAAEQLLALAQDQRVRLILATVALTPEATADPRTRAALTKLWTSGRCERIDLSAFDRDACAQLLREIHPGTRIADEAWSDVLFRLSGGSPVLLRALAAEAVRRGTPFAHVPLLPGTLAYVPSPMIIEALRPRLEQLTVVQLSTLVVLGRLGALPIERVQRLVDPTDLTVLIEHGFAHLGYGTGLLRVGEAVAQVATTILPRGALDSALATVADEIAREAIAGLPLRDPSALLLATQWLAGADSETPQAWWSAPSVRSIVRRSALLLSRAGDQPSAMHMSRLLLRDGPDFAASLILARAQASVHDHEAATTTLDGLEPPATRAQAHELVRARSSLLLWHRSDLDGVERFLERARGWFPDDQSWREQLELRAAPARLLSLDLSQTVLPHTGSPITRAYQALAIARNGDPVRAIELLQTGIPHDAPERAPFPLFLAWAWIELFLPEEPERLMSTLRRAETQARRHHRLDRLLAIAWIQAESALSTGDGAEALSALERYSSDDAPEAIQHWLLLQRARARTAVGLLDSAADDLAQVVDGALRSASTLFSLLVERAGIEFDLAAGNVERAQRRAVRAVAAARPFPILAAAISVLARAAGAPVKAVAREMSQLAALHPDPAIALVTAQLLGSGAEASADLYLLHPAGTAARPSESEETSDRLSVLSAREREIVLMAAHGTSNLTIAATLYLSVRTVESHLHHARVKLGLSGRQSLQTLLEREPPTPSRHWRRA